jgi:D-3-phosphoglycerate dehydrogenase
MQWYLSHRPAASWREEIAVPATILITGPNLAADAVRVLEDAGYQPVYVPPYTDNAGLLQAVAQSQPVGIISRMGRVEASIFDAAPQLRVVSKHGVGFDNIDIDAASLRGVPVLVASGAIALLFAVAKKLLPLDHGMRQGRWDKPGFKGRELSGSTMGLVAFGAIAQHTARFAQAFGITVRAYDPFCAPGIFEQARVTQEQSLDRLLEDCDIISLHCPLTANTRNLINAERLSRMRPDAILINTARGGLIDELALVEALRDDRIAGAGLDTFAQEPPRQDHPFFDDDRLVVTPHIGGVTTAANTRVGVEAAQGIVDFLAGRPLEAGRVVNRSRLPQPPTTIDTLEREK